MDKYGQFLGLGGHSGASTLVYTSARRKLHPIDYVEKESIFAKILVDIIKKKCSSLQTQITNTSITLYDKNKFLYLKMLVNSEVVNFTGFAIIHKTAPMHYWSAQYFNIT